jgi:hypothetical protein
VDGKLSSACNGAQPANHPRTYPYTLPHVHILTARVCLVHVDNVDLRLPTPTSSPKRPKLGALRSRLVAQRGLHASCSCWLNTTLRARVV